MTESRLLTAEELEQIEDYLIALANRDEIEHDIPFAKTYPYGLLLHIRAHAAALRSQEKNVLDNPDVLKQYAAEWEERAVAEAKRADQAEAQLTTERERAARAERREDALRAELSAAFRKNGLAAGPLEVDHLAERASVAEERFAALAWWLEQRKEFNTLDAEACKLVRAYSGLRSDVPPKTLPEVLDELRLLRALWEGVS
jgi:hypothetical protein